MNKLALAAVPGLLLLTALIACDDDSSSGPNFDFDAGGFDANLPPSNPNDASTPDASQDADADAPVIPAVSVTVRTLAGPKAGVRVVWNDAEGAVIESKLTGADGKATHEGTDAATVSALLVRGERQHIVTWTGVEVGDDLQLLARAEDQELGTYTVTLPDTSPGAFQYSVTSPCDGRQTYGTAAVLTNSTACARPTNSVLVSAIKNNDGPPTYSFAFKKGNAVPPTGDLGILAGAWALATPVSVSVANLPTEPRLDVDLLEIADGYGFRSDFMEGSQTPNTFATATGFAEAHQGAAYFWGDADIGSSRVIAQRAAPAATIALDYQQLLPELTNASIDVTNLARPILAWEGGSTETTDGGIVRFRFTNPTSSDNYWTVIVRPGSSSVTAPALPAEAATFLPTEESEIGTPDVIFFESDLLPSYKAFRGQQGLIVGTFEDDLYEYRAPALPANGSLRATSWTPVSL